ncbi:MAG TPA: SDR family oxidoreductase [Acidimicrobiales bacterium]|nr:SDR family oxidoreductase [Acidimicrobiales bacterium]
MTDAPALQDRVALVVGGAVGLGRGITDGLLAAGASVAVAQRNQPDELPAGARFFGADVREADETDRLVNAVVDHHGRLDVVVTGVGGSPQAAAATAAASWSRAIVTVNLLAPLHVATAANRVMQGQDEGGAIVTIGSLDALRPAPGAAAYGAAKAGLVSLTQSLAAEWGPEVRVNCVSAGVVTADPAAVPGDERDLAEAVALGRPGTPADLAAAVTWLASPAAAYVSGANLVVHGGGARPAFLAAIAGS